jgi:ornithine cyclodeaminase/alanine dehydrogenase-like protein (mu-crystallin family)
MRIISSDEIDACLEDRAVLETLRRAFRSSTIVPDTTSLEIDRLDQLTGNLSVQPAWTDFAAQRDVSRGYIGCSLSLALPEQQGVASSLYVLFSGSTGQPIALLDGMRLDVWRSAGVHALAASYLSREDTSRLLVIGDDPRLPRLLMAYACVRDFTSILFAGTSEEIRKRIASLPALANVQLGVTTEIYAAQEGADMICIAGLERITPSPISIHLSAVTLMSWTRRRRYQLTSCKKHGCFPQTCLLLPQQSLNGPQIFLSWRRATKPGVAITAKGPFSYPAKGRVLPITRLQHTFF